ncbi:FAD/NAD(P)-binding domain-containing protein [Mycena filopes]|nr:FAD/NAD(P)-binding domain-containing protein [Mycena filopes]
MASPNTPTEVLKVSIVGAGIAGLAASIALRRNGHRVEIFEAANVIEEVGAAIVVPLNAQRVLKSFGYSKANLNSVDFTGLVAFDAVTGESKSGEWMLPALKETPASRSSWSDLHGELHRLATGPGEGPPAVIHVGSKVTKCDPDESVLTLSDGRVILSDLILGADGIASSVRTSILGEVKKTVPSGLTIYRGLIDMDKFEGRAEFDWLRDGISGPRMAVRGDGVGLFRMFFVYPCRGGTVLNIGAIFQDPKQKEADWKVYATRTEVLETFADFNPMFRHVLEALDDPVMKWQLRRVPVLPTWIRGHAALLGDAAHGTLPTMGQGSAMALEDAGALGVLFPAGTLRSDVPGRLAGYQALRKERGEFINQESLEQATLPQKLGRFFASREMQEQVLDFDAIQAAQDYFKQNFE